MIPQNWTDFLCFIKMKLAFISLLIINQVKTAYQSDFSNFSQTRCYLKIIMSDHKRVGRTALIFTVNAEISADEVKDTI